MNSILSPLGGAVCMFPWWDFQTENLGGISSGSREQGNGWKMENGKKELSRAAINNSRDSGNLVRHSQFRREIKSSCCSHN